MKLRVLFFVLLVTIFPASLLSNTLYFPQVAFGGGYSTTFTIVNTGTTAVSGRLNLYSQAGSLRADLGRQLDIAPGNSTRHTIPNSGPLTVVWGEFNAGAGTVQGVATFDNRDIAGRLVTSAGVLGIEANNTFLIPVDVTSTASTGLAVSNISNSPLTLDIRLVDESGVTVATSAEGRFAPLAAHGHVADFVPAIISQIAGSSFKGTMVIRSPAAAPSLAVTALTVKEGLLSALPVLAGSSGGASILEFPQVVFGGGYSTTFTVMNAGASPVSAQLRFFTQVGVERTDLSTTMSLSGNGSTRYLLPDSGQLTVVSGELVTTSGTVQAVATFDLRAPNQSLLTTAGVLGVQPGKAFSVPVDVTPAGGTGIAFSNTKDRTVGLSLRLIGENAAQVAGAPDGLISARAQAVGFVSNIFPQAVGTSFKGALVIEAAADAPAGSLAVTALTFNEGVLSALPVIPGALVISSGDTGSGGSGGGTGGGTLGGGPASQCLDPTLYTAPTTMHLEYNQTIGGTTATGILDFVSTLNVEFEGQLATEVRTQVFLPGAIQRLYVKLDGIDIVTYGHYSDFPVPGAIKTVYSPPRRDKRYSLAVGESATQTITITTTSPIPGLPTSSTTLTGTIKYLGRETITVPAGTFETCKFEEDDGRVFDWRGVGNGLLIKNEIPGPLGVQRYELKSGTVNGQPVRP